MSRTSEDLDIFHALHPILVLL